MADSRGRLEKLIGMLGSEFDGERANAAAMIAKLAKSEGKTIAELLLRGPERVIYREKVVYKEAPDRPYDRRPPAPRRPLKKPRGVLFELYECLRNEDLTEWDYEFIWDVVDSYSHPYELTDRQMRMVKRIIRRSKRSDAEPLI